MNDIKYNLTICLCHGGLSEAHSSSSRVLLFYFRSLQNIFTYFLINFLKLETKTLTSGTICTFSLGSQCSNRLSSPNMNSMDFLERLLSRLNICPSDCFNFTSDSQYRMKSRSMWYPYGQQLQFCKFCIVVAPPKTKMYKKFIMWDLFEILFVLGLLVY